MWNVKATIILVTARTTMIQKVPQKHTWEERHQGTKKSSRTDHRTQTSKSTEV